MLAKAVATSPKSGGDDGDSINPVRAGDTPGRTHLHRAIQIVGRLLLAEGVGAGPQIIKIELAIEAGGLHEWANRVTQIVRASQRHLRANDVAIGVVILAVAVAIMEDINADIGWGQFAKVKGATHAARAKGNIGEHIVANGG